MTKQTKDDLDLEHYVYEFLYTKWMQIFVGFFPRASRKWKLIAKQETKLDSNASQKREKKLMEFVQQFSGREKNLKYFRI